MQKSWTRTTSLSISEARRLTRLTIDPLIDTIVVPCWYTPYRFIDRQQRIECLEIIQEIRWNFQIIYSKEIEEDFQISIALESTHPR